MIGSTQRCRRGSQSIRSIRAHHLAYSAATAIYSACRRGRHRGRCTRSRFTLASACARTGCAYRPCAHRCELSAWAEPGVVYSTREIRICSTCQPC